MDLFSRFKKDYFNYLVSIILPALISGVSIPVFKHLLGAEGYGKFSIWLNAVLIITAVSSGWITQSIIRLFPASENKYSFSRKAIKLSLETQLIFFAPVFFTSWFISKDIFLAILCSLVLLMTSLQFTVLPVIQSGFLSRKIITSESIRILTYVGLALLLLKLSGISYIYSLFIAAFISYTFSLIYLGNQAYKFFHHEHSIASNKNQNPKLFKSFFKYGAPLSLWFIFSYLFSYIDKLFMYKYMGAEAQGNYQAIFDLLFRGVSMIMSPVLTSLFPILTSAYTRGNNKEIRKLMKKIISYEIIGFLLSSVLYWWFADRLLLSLLKIPNTFSFKLMGFIVLCATFIWQIAILVQKRFELKQRTFYLLAMAFFAFLVQLLFYIIFKDLNNLLVYPLGFLLSTFVYLLLISATELLTISKLTTEKLKYRIFKF
jgi:O-antigen/teichoic acid export membrane protein